MNFDTARGACARRLPPVSGVRQAERINHEMGTATAIITHNVDIAGMADRVIHLSNGKIAEATVNKVKKSANDLQW